MTAGALKHRLEGEPTRIVQPPGGADATRERTGVQSLERAFAILEEVAQQRSGISLADLSKRVGLHNSTTFHLVRTMVTLGYIRQDRETKRYHVGRMVFSLAASSLSEVELVGLATPVLEDLARETGESSHFALRRGEDVVIAARVAGSGAFQLVDRGGGVRPAHCTALGKVLLAAMPPERFERYLSSAPPRPFDAEEHHRCRSPEGGDRARAGVGHRL